MSISQWAVLAAAAVLVFWMVGAYNRLVALRSRIGSAWADVEAARRHRAGAVEPLCAALRGPLSAEQGALDAFTGLHRQSADAAAMVSGSPVSILSTAAWVLAEAALTSAAARVLALADQQRDALAREGNGAAPQLAVWHEGQTRLGFARRVFDTAAADYNAALMQPPTRWLRRLFGFGPAGSVG